MSFRAERLRTSASVQAFDWCASASGSAHVAAKSPEPVNQSAVAAIERDAFLKGYGQGEKAGAEAAAKRCEGMLRRLGETLEELTSLRADMLRRTEKQMVQLALAVARRIVQREVSLDRGVLIGMARCALDRLGERASATVRLHPDDHAASTAGLPPAAANPHVQFLADPLVSRGSCLIESDFGFMDASPEAQFAELARVLLDEDEPATKPVHAGAVHDVISR